MNAEAKSQDADEMSEALTPVRYPAAVVRLRPRPTLLTRLLEWFVRLAAKRCQHPSHEVAADVLEGQFTNYPGGTGTAVQYCACCGAVRIMYDGQPCAWRLPGRAW